MDDSSQLRMLRTLAAILGLALVGCQADSVQSTTLGTAAAASTTTSTAADGVLDCLEGDDVWFDEFDLPEDFGFENRQAAVEAAFKHWSDRFHDETIIHEGGNASFVRQGREVVIVGLYDGPSGWAYNGPSYCGEVS